MRKHAQKMQEDAAIDMTPMLDIVFIMLIFFIVTSAFIKEAGVDVDRPKAYTTEKQKKASIMIAVNKANEVWMQKQKVDVRGIGARVEKLRAENPEGSVVVQADAKAKSGVVMEVVDALRSAGITNYVVSAEQK